MKKAFYLVATLVALLWASSCSVNFRATIKGSVVDQDLYEADSTKGAIGNVRVYLYLSQADRDKDYQRWEESGLCPDEPQNSTASSGSTKSKDKTKPLYVASVVTTATDGTFAINNIWWTDYASKYGTDASVKNGYFLFYHDSYGLVAYTKDVKLIGDGNTVTLPPFPIKKDINETVVKGRIVDANLVKNGQSVGVANVSVKIYTAKKWSMNGESVEVANEDWKYEPSYTVTTNADGYFSQSISYPKYIPGISQKISKTKIRLTYELAGYSAFCLTTEANQKFSGYDVNGNPYSESRSVDLTSSTNWVLLDGAKTDVSYYDHKNGNSVTVSVGRDGSDVTKCDFDFNADGTKDIYYEIEIVSDGTRRENIMTINELKIRKNQLSATIYGKVLDTSANGVIGAAVSFYWFNKDDTKISSVNSSASGSSNNGNYSATITLTSYNHTAASDFTMPIWIDAKKDSLKADRAKYDIDFGIEAAIQKNLDLTIK